jgi:spore maturation protein CgeB
LKTIIFISPYLEGPSAARWIFKAWKTGFEHEGYNCIFCQPDELDKISQKLTPDLIWCDVVCSPVENKNFASSLEKMRSLGAKVLLWLYWPLWDLPSLRSEIIEKYDIADLYIGEREQDAMYGFEEKTGKKYHTLPMFANSKLHKPVNINNKFSYDLAFVGAKLPKKKWFNDRILKPSMRKYNVGLFGTNWTMADNIKRAGSKLSRIAHMPKLSTFIDKTRFSIPDSDEATLYSSSKISLNFHERAPDLSQPHHVMNHRAFKIIACGGFQICDRVKGMSKYFNEDELVMLDCNEDTWFEKIEYFLNSDKDRQAYIEKGMERVNKEHLDFHRVRQLESLLEKL